jgi:hypothetical protein
VASRVAVKGTILAAGEVGVVLMEALLYTVAAPLPPRRALGVSLFANVCSLILGVLVHHLTGWP